ncbi:MAG: rRNA maturation RNase YbeY [Candidatus Nealsonbacteria bacterium CG02_land_8_20_14_3_00_37_10]|uniref:Endoribonuclease YbeY n=2 Tax=Candidatus Nealsoniibacteriota TaxID=1817911 RepID=A0A2G9YYV5_9BACT|nr:MAG: rRNA maturation RNase YbeY [Candidatus Nealsonbacteria bacterium CG23_combo_of_CG06-09_8_20_14_all_37_18]PIV45172.1 MAG: rRNA maturation RNase YbeY [Candidatus Nealsonbacteria bacterium CG02_land_8_20_14_3_00_37_10]
MIEINNLTTNLVDEEFLKKIAKKVLEGEHPLLKRVLGGAGLSIVLVGQGRIKELNKRYRGKNRVTDVLSFRYGDSGEIVICLQEIKKNAKKFKSATELPLAEARGKKRTKSSSPFEKELAKVLIHGVLHLLGYDHEKGEGEENKSSSSTSSRKRDSVKEARKMEEKQKYYLKKFF